MVVVMDMEKMNEINNEFLDKCITQPPPPKDREFHDFGILPSSLAYQICFWTSLPTSCRKRSYIPGFYNQHATRKIKR